MTVCVELTIHSAAKAYSTNQLQLKRCTRVTRTRHKMDTKCICTRHVLQTQTHFTKNTCINALREHAGRILNTRVPCVQDSVHACVSSVAKMFSEQNSYYCIKLFLQGIRLPTLWLSYLHSYSYILVVASYMMLILPIHFLGI